MLPQDGERLPIATSSTLAEHSLHVPRSHWPSFPWAGCWKLLFFLLEQGEIVIDPAESGDAVGTITALASNPAVAHVSSLLVPPSLVTMLFGLAGISGVIQGERMSGGFSRLGILCITIGGTGWILTAELNHVLADTVWRVIRQCSWR